MSRLSLRMLPLALVPLALVLTACPTSPPSKDTTPPKIKSITPADGTTDVDPAVTIEIAFSEPVKKDSVKVELKQGDTAVEGLLAVDGSGATFQPTQELAPNAPFTFAVTAYADNAGNNGAPQSVSFSTTSSIPSVLSTEPADGAINVAPTAAISAHFSRLMNADSINAYSFIVQDGTNMVAGQVTYEAGEHVATFTPAKALFEGREYSVTLTTEITDTAGNHLGGAKKWTFTTAATVPSVTSITPTNGTTDVPGNTTIQVAFSEDMDPDTINDQTFQVGVMGGEAVAGAYSWDGPTRTAIFQPASAFPGGATITVHLTNGIKDRSGIALESPVDASFVISSAPSVATSSPEPDQTDISLGSMVSLAFTQPMDVTTLTSANVWIEDDQAMPVAATYVPAASTLTLTPNEPLNESTVYSVVVSTGVKSASGVPFAAEYRFTFTTVGIPPQVVAVTPAPLATDVPVSSSVKLSFNEPMDTATFTAANLHLSDGAADVTTTINAIDSQNVELVPSAPLLEKSSYTLVAGTGLTDAAGNPLQSEFRASFVTEPLPRIVSINPAPNAQNVPNGSAIILVANKGLDASTVTITPSTGTPANTVTLFEEGSIIEGAIQYDAATRSIRVTRLNNGAAATWTSGKRYTLTVDGAQLLDLSGNAVGGVVSTTFVAGASGDTTEPTVLSMNPVQGQVGVARSENPYALFSEPLDPTSLSSANVKLEDGTTPLAGRIEYVQADQKVVFIPDAPLPANKQLTFTVGQGIKDTSGNAKSISNSVSFTTQDNTEPALAAISPEDGATDVNVNTAIRLAFTEPIDGTSLSIEIADGTTLITGSVSYDAATSSAVFKSASDLPAGKALTVTVKSGLKDQEGLATTADIVSTFTTIANSAHDVTVPAVSGSIPANAATGVSAHPSIQLSFSEPLDPTTVAVSQFTLQEQGGNKVPFGLAYSVGSDTATLTPSIPLTAGATYEVKVLGGLTDLAGNAVDPMAVSSTVTFTVDGSAPTLVARNPASGSTVGSSIAVSVTFSEDMNASGIDAASMTLSTGGTPVLATVWYDPSGRTAFLRPATKLTDGTYTVSLDGARVTDLAGNGLTDSYSFTVSSAGPSVVSATPCGTVVDANDFGTATVSVTFDPGVQKPGGGALDGSAIQLRVNNTAVTATVAHTAGATVATLTPGSALLPDTTYEVFVDQAQVENASTHQTMTSSYSCTFRTQKVVFEDDVDPAPASMWSNGVVGSNQWEAVNSVSDPSNSTQVWRGSNATDGQNYARSCGLGGQAQTVVLERDVTLPNVTKLLLRLDEWHAMGASANDKGRVVIVYGGNPVEIASFTGSGQTAYAAKEYDLTAYKNATVKLRFELQIAAGNVLSCPAGGAGFYVDNIRIVGE